MAARTFEEAFRLVFQTDGTADLEAVERVFKELGDVSDETQAKLSAAMDELLKAREAKAAAEALSQLIEKQRELADATDSAGLRLKLASEAEAAAAAAVQDRAAALAAAKAAQEEYAQQADRMLLVEKELAAAVAEAAAAQKEADAEWKSANAALKGIASEYERVTTAQQKLEQQIKPLAESVEKAGQSTDDLGRSQRVLAEQADRAQASFVAIAYSAHEMAQAEHEAADAGKELAKSTRQAANETGSLAEVLERTKTSLFAAGAAIFAFTRSVSGAAQASGDLETAMKAISTIAHDADIPVLTKQVEELSRQFGGPAAKQAKALYDIIALGVEDTAEAMGVLAVANKLAIGGLTDVDTAASGLVATLSAYKLRAADAQRVSDAFFVSAATGSASIEGLAEGIGSVATLAESAGVEIEELAAAVGALTKGGLSTSAAITQVRSLLTAIVKPTADAKEQAELLGIQFDTAAIKAQGFSNWLAEVGRVSGGSESALAQLFGRIDGLQGALALTGSQAETFAEAMAKMRGEVSATEDAYGKMAERGAQSVARFEAAWDGLKRAIGDVLVALSPVLDAITSVINGFTSLPEPVKATAAAVGLLTAGIVTLVGAIGALRPVLVALGGLLGSSGIAAGAAAAAGSLSKMGGALGLLRSTVAGFLVVAGPLYIYDQWKGWIDGARDAAEAQRELAAATGSLETRIEQFKRVYGELADLQIRSNQEVERLSGYNLNAYTTQLEGAARYWRAIEIEAKRAGDTSRQAMAKERAQEYAVALGAVRDRTKSLSDAAAKAAEDIGVRLRQAFKDLNLESQASLNTAATKAADALKVVIDAARQGKAAQEDVRRAFDAWAEAARKAAADSDEAGKKAVEAQIKAQQAALETAGVMKKIADAPKAAAESVREVGAGLIDVERSANTADRAIQQMSNNTEGSAEALAGVLNGMRDALRVYGDEAVAEFDRVFQAAASIDGVLQTTGLSYTQVLGKVADMANFVAEKFKIAQEAAERQARSMAYLQENAEEAAAALARQGKTLEDLRSGAISAHDALMALGNQRMHKLRPELEGVEAALEGIEQKARDAVASLAEMNDEFEKARLQRIGDERGIEELRYQEELRRIKDLAEAAGAAGAAEAAEARRLAEAEHQARLREIKEREKAEKDAQREVAREREASSSASGSGRSGSSRGANGDLGGERERRIDRVIRVEFPGIGNVDVADDDSAAVLERGLEAVARAARAGRRIG